MIREWEAKDIVLGVNGEIYNYTDLQDELEARQGGHLWSKKYRCCRRFQERAPKKHKFLTKSDCEAQPKPNTWLRWSVGQFGPPGLAPLVRPGWHRFLKQERGGSRSDRTPSNRQLDHARSKSCAIYAFCTRWSRTMGCLCPVSWGWVFCGLALCLYCVFQATFGRPKSDDDSHGRGCIPGRIQRLHTRCVECMPSPFGTRKTRRTWPK